MISKQYSQNALLYLCKQCVGDAGTYRCTIARFSPLGTHLGYLTTQNGYLPGRKPNDHLISLYIHHVSDCLLAVTRTLPHRISPLLMDLYGHGSGVAPAREARCEEGTASPRSCLGLEPVNERPCSVCSSRGYSANSALGCLLVHYLLPDNDRHVRRCHRHRQYSGTPPYCGSRLEGAEARAFARARTLLRTRARLAATSISALLPSGKAPTTRVRRRISRMIRSSGLLVLI